MWTFLTLLFLLPGVAALATFTPGSIILGLGMLLVSGGTATKAYHKPNDVDNFFAWLIAACVLAGIALLARDLIAWLWHS